MEQRRRWEICVISQRMSDSKKLSAQETIQVSQSSTFCRFFSRNMLKSSSKHATQVKTGVWAHAFKDSMPYTWFDSNRLPSLCVCYVNPRGRNENRLGKRKQKFVLSSKWLLFFVCYMVLRSVKCNEFLKTTSFPHLRIDKGTKSRIKRRFKGIKAMELDFLLDACWDDLGNESGERLAMKTAKIC